MTDELHRDLGRHDAQIENLERRVEAMEKKIDTVIEILSQAKGGWRTLMAVGGFAAAIGGAINWAVSTFYKG